MRLADGVRLAETRQPRYVLCPTSCPHITPREGFFGRLKTELFYSSDWKIITIEQFVHEIDAIRWYNEKRIKLSLGSLSPIDYRRGLGLNI
ncbi:hypothetical protein AGR8A_pAt20137 [Agrobacterium fabrum str. J-07]|nr:hypothetical protein AGR8A_pAt20137 [Agrobacterium fabrum str. J-07]